ncbi:ribosome-binding factor A domain-containing protein [Haematococcus lacustris]
MLTHHQASCIGPGCAAGVRLQPRCTPVPQAPMLVSNVVAAPTQQPAQLVGRSRGIGIGSLSVVCMAHPRRVAKVSSAIQRELSQLFLYDKVLSQAICPDRRLGGDEISAVASITDVYVSNDLQVVKVYVSIYSDSQGKKTAMENLKRLEPYVRRVMAQRVVLRLTPEYRFEYDDSIEEADLVRGACMP